MKQETVAEHSGKGPDMGHFISFPEEAPHQKVDRLVLNLVDPATDAGSIARLISGSLGTLDSEPAAHFNVDPLIDYRAQRPWMNYQNGRLAGKALGASVKSYP